jgi:predicted nucleotidyltransferase
MRDDKTFRKSLNLILEVLKKNLNSQAKVYLFGSSVKGDYKKFSDIDIAIENGDKEAITNIRYQIENLNIPYKVEIIDLSKVSKEFKKEILKTGVLIWKN